MLYHQFEETLHSKEVLNKRVLPLWLFPMEAPLKEISLSEEKIAKTLPKKRSRQYKHTRGYVRLALSRLFGIRPLDVPLIASPGQVPKLETGWGYISFSHCSDALFLGWNSKRLGVDIERTDRPIASKWIGKRYLNSQEKEGSTKLTEEEFRLLVLENWVTKEAAIKWQRGMLARDLSKWCWNKKRDVAFHNEMKYEVNIFNLTFKSWFIAVAYQNQFNISQPIICSS